MNLPEIEGKYKYDSDLAHLTWFKVGGKAEILFKPKNNNDLAKFLQQNNGKRKVTVFGAGSNLIIRDGGVDGVVVKLGQGFNDIEVVDKTTLLVGSGCLNYNLSKFAQINSISNFEFLVGIPGTIGGGIAMNAGAYGTEFKDILKYVYALDARGKERKIKIDENSFSYRKNHLPPGLIFTKAEFKIEQGDGDLIQERMNYINQSRANTQPITERTGGSTFANPVGKKAWQLIDESGLRGYKIGGASMSEKHCNFMINDGSATAADMENLGNYVIDKVQEHTSILLKWEIKIIGKNE